MSLSLYSRVGCHSVAGAISGVRVRVATPTPATRTSQSSGWWTTPSEVDSGWRATTTPLTQSMAIATTATTMVGRRSASAAWAVRSVTNTRLRSTIGTTAANTSLVASSHQNFPVGSEGVWGNGGLEEREIDDTSTIRFSSHCVRNPIRPNRRGRRVVLGRVGTLRPRRVPAGSEF